MLRLLDVYWFRTTLVVALAASGCDGRVADADEPHAAPLAARVRTQRARTLAQDMKPAVAVEDVMAADLCVTKGKLADARIEVPTFRAVALGKGGDAASVNMVVHGATAKSRALASGQERRQIGLKLRAEDGCNLVYVMWRLDPKPKIEVSLKRNAGQHTSKECGAGGYTKVKPTFTLKPTTLPALDDGLPHTLRAEISGDALNAWVDGAIAWQGSLPVEARDLVGPAGVRSDNLAFELTGFATDARRATNTKAKCVAGDDEDGASSSHRDAE